MEEEQVEIMDMPLLKDEIESCRHKSEKRWYRFLVLLNSAIIIGVLVVCLIHITDYRKTVTRKINDDASGFVQEVADALATEDLFEGKIPTELKLLGAGILIAFLIPLSIYYYYAQLRISSVRITERNFPEVYELIERYSKRLGLKEAPKAYVVQSSGALNAYSSFIIKKQYIEINSELFEIAYREHKDLDALGFVIGHELAHIRYGHATLHYNIPIWLVMSLPIIGTTASRAREYSCDRLSQKLTGNDGVRAMFALIVDRHLYPQVDREDYLKEANEQNGLFVWVNNLLSTHPVATKRIIALDQKEGSGKLY